MSQTLAINSDYKRSLLEGLELFQGVSAEDVQELLQRCDRRDVDEGETLLSPGSKNEHVFIVLAGSLNVHVGAPDAPILTTMGRRILHTGELGSAFAEEDSSEDGGVSRTEPSTK